MSRHLRRSLPIAMILLALPLEIASAQAAFGVIGGFNRARFTGSGAVDVASRSAFLVGAVGDFPITETFSIRPELHFSAKGAEVRTELGSGADGFVKAFALSYVQLPLLAQLRPQAGGSVRPHLFAGISVGAMLGCKLGTVDCDDIQEIHQHGMDASVLMGGEIGLSRVAFGVRYEAGIRAVDATVPGNEIYNGVISFTLRYMP
ncbi:MAG: porin family protein [Gemmatimonadetes bacterium]|nr:porin family protein [Gemmatimonadota bacterium]MCY3677088.1 porin family protein [Gemmatimonadota bacterium]